MSGLGLVGVGYEGRTIDDLIGHLLALGVTRLVDVRLNAISRKPGFSKTALANALGDAGISYVHQREFGNPKASRAGFAGDDAELAEARAAFSALLQRSEAVDALDALAQASLQEGVAVLCFEADQRRCHRDVVLAEAQRRGASVA